jgi:CysZ protein
MLAPRQGQPAAAAWNSISAVLVHVGWLLTLPLWLIPGALLLPILWMAWLTRRTFAYDALTVHATDDEWRALAPPARLAAAAARRHLALLAHIPILGLLTPTLAALAYTHYCLEALRRFAAGRGGCGCRRTRGEEEHEFRGDHHR